MNLKVQCRKCETMILESTSDRTGGLCMPCKDRKISTKILEQHLSEGKKQMNVLVLTKKSLVHQFKTVGSEIIGELRPGDEFPLVRQLHYDINRWVKTILPKQRKQDVSLL